MEWRRNDALPAAELETTAFQEEPVVAATVPPIAAYVLCVTPRSTLTSRETMTQS